MEAELDSHGPHRRKAFSLNLDDKEREGPRIAWVLVTCHMPHGASTEHPLGILGPGPLDQLDPTCAGM